MILAAFTNSSHSLAVQMPFIVVMIFKGMREQAAEEKAEALGDGLERNLNKLGVNGGMGLFKDRANHLFAISSDRLYANSSNSAEYLKK